MIRRDMVADDRSPAAWILIPQIEHAHLAGRLAAAWGAAGFAPLVPRDELLWAIDHHDDGWRDWDQTPGVNPAGQPRTFTEMEPDVSMAIWADSIDRAAKAGPLQGYLVAGHFSALGHRACAGKDTDPAWHHAAEFLAHYDARMIDWLTCWQTADAAANTRAVAERALRQLQFFDSFSLWFCCDEATAAETVETPGGHDFTITPRTPANLTLSPWPFTTEPLAIEATGRVVPATHYATRDELAAAESRPITLRWQLGPSA